jgi:hypothetical protein
VSLSLTRVVAQDAVAETGLHGYEAVLHYGLLAPPSTPKPMVEKLNRCWGRGSRPPMSRSDSPRRRASPDLAGGICRRHRSGQDELVERPEGRG